MNMKRLRYNLLVALGLLVTALPMMTSCSDEPDSENYYTFKGEMLSTYLQTRPQYSQFAQIVDRAGLMNLLSSYGTYTCFVPTNEAVDTYLKEEGYGTMSALLQDQAQCDTIARTHLLNVLYSTYDMPNGVLTQPNMNNRYLEVSRVLDNDSNSVVYLNEMAKIYFELQDDSVENGIVHPIDHVLKSSNRMLPDVIGENPNVSIYNEALHLTGLRTRLFDYKDATYTQPIEDDGQPTWHYYETGGSLSDPIKEYARAPEERLLGFTAFLVPDSILKAKYGIDKASGNAMQKLYELACTIYPETINTGLENADKPENPLYKFMAYHILNRDSHGYNLLTVVDDIGIDINKMNPTEWYGTLLPYSLMKVEKLTVRKYMGVGEMNDRYINRRVDDRYNIEGSHIIDPSKVSDGYKHQAMNGYYFYVDDVVKFDNTMKEDVMNCRMRMDMSAVFPELMTNSIRMNMKGNGLWEAANDQKAASLDERWGTNYYFPDGYLDGVTIGNNGYLCYRRPRYGFWSYSGDEFVCNGNFDVTMRIPPVPLEGDYQIRLGYAAMSVRGIAQIYFDGAPQGIPLDMRRDMQNEALLGSEYWGKHDDEYNKTPENGGMTDEEKLEERKELKNKGFYRGANGAYRKGSSSDAGQYFAEIYATIRIVLCTPHIKPGEDHYLRFRCVSEGLGNNEIMLDYIELVPKSVYGVVDEGVQEDDL